MSKDNCYCCSGLAFNKCCAPFISLELAPPTPKALMRSRFSAHCVGRWQYLLDSWHPDTQVNVDAKNLQQSIQLCQWLGLEIIDTGFDETSGFVEFDAWYKYADKLSCLHERSTFKKVKDSWLYLEGDVEDRLMTETESKKWSLMPVLNQIISTQSHKVGRNDLCPCESGKKYKKCCDK